MNYNKESSNIEKIENNKNDKNNTNEIDNKQKKVRKKVTQACENCRKKRRKCTGERPKCLTCLQYNYVCYYNPFPRKRGPQQKREKRRYRKRDKANETGNKNKNDEGLTNLKLIGEQFKRSTKLLDVNITQSIYNNIVAYKTSIHHRFKTNINEIPTIEKDLINYSVIDMYYKYFHPCYPVISKNTFTNFIKNDSLSKYLLFSMYGMAYLFQQTPDIPLATEYIDKAKELIYQNYGLIDVQLLQSLYLITIFESGNSQSWFYSGLAFKIIEDNYFYYLNQCNNKDSYFEDLEIIKSISIAFYGYDTWNNIFIKNENIVIKDIKKFIDERSNILISFIAGASKIKFEYFVVSASILLLELFSITSKIKENDFLLEDIDSINTDIIKTQNFFFKYIDDLTLICFNDITEDFSYYVELAELADDNDDDDQNNFLLGIRYSLNMNQDQKFDYQNGNHSKSKKNKTKHNRNSNNSTSTSTTTTTTNSNSNNHNNNGFSSNIPSTFNIDNIVNNGNVNNIVNTNLGSNINTNNSFNINTNTNNNNHNNNTNISINKLVNIINTDIDTKTTMNKKNNIDNLLFKKDYNNNEMNDSFSINPNNNNNNTICNSKNNNNNDIKKSNFKPSLINDDYDKDPFLNITDNKQVYYEIIKRISYDNNFFNRKYNFLKIKCKDNITMTVFDMYQLVMLSLDDFPKKKNWTKFSLITSAQRICLNREYVMHIIKNPNKIKKYPIAKSVAIASKTADDCTIGLLLLMEASRENNNHPVRFSYCKSWVFYQCCIVYIIRYVATQESKYIKFYSKESLKYSNFSSFPQETLAPCYFYLNLLKQMRSYFPQVQNIIYEIKLLINQAIKAIREKTFDIVINEILFNNV